MCCSLFRGSVYFQVNCLDPGTVNTKMLLAYWGPIGIDVGDANGELFLITDPSVAKTTGKYFVSQRESRAPSVSLKYKKCCVLMFCTISLAKCPCGLCWYS